MNVVARDLERHLRETSPRPGNNSKPPDLAHAADELAKRLEPVVKKQAKAADALAALEAGPRRSTLSTAAPASGSRP